MVDFKAAELKTVELKAVDKYYGKIKALQNISLTLHQGEVLGLFGHNGAGKTTMMKLILGLIAPDKGEVRTLGHTPTAVGSQEYRRQFGYLPENVSFYDQLEGYDVLNYFARLKGYGKNEVNRLLDEVGLSEAARRPVKTYSKGMRQRLGLAQALLGEPKLLLLDEPTVGLDPIATRDFYTVVDRLKGQGCSVILCSHLLSGVEAHIDRAMIVGGGKQLTLGTLQELRVKADLPIEIKVQGLTVAHLNEYLAGFLKKENHNHNHSQFIFNVSLTEKMQVLKQLLLIAEISDINIYQPSLSDIYSYYLDEALSYE